MFTQIDPLPRAQGQPPCPHWDTERCSEQRRLDMCGHVVGAFAGMTIGKILWSDHVERRFQVQRDIRVGILVDRQRRRSVLDEDIQQTSLEFCQFWNGGDHLRRDQVKST